MELRYLNTMSSWYTATAEPSKEKHKTYGHCVKRNRVKRSQVENRQGNISTKVKPRLFYYRSIRQSTITSYSCTIYILFLYHLSNAWWNRSGKEFKRFCPDTVCTVCLCVYMYITLYLYCTYMHIYPFPIQYDYINTYTCMYITLYWSNEAMKRWATSVKQRNNWDKGIIYQSNDGFIAISPS